MSKSISFYAAFNERTGYGIHGSRFAEALEKVTTVFRNQPGGDINLTLIDSVSIQNIKERLPYPSICYNVWESTEQPQWFIDQFNKYFDYLWVPSEWQRSCSIAQGIPEEKVFVVPEGVDPEVYKPDMNTGNENAEFTFIHVGQWQPRKSTLEIIQSFLKAFPANKSVRLELSADTLFPSDNYKSTEERLAANGIIDSRISVIHFEEREAYLRRLQSAHCFVSCSRSEGWGLPIQESMACGIPTIVADWGGSTEYAGNAINVRIKELRKPTGIYGNWDVPGFWAEPDYDDLVIKMQNVYIDYSQYKSEALRESEIIRNKFSWESAAKKALEIIEQIPNQNISQGISQNISQSINQSTNQDPEESIRSFARSKGYEIDNLRKRKAIFVIDSFANSQDRLDTLVETISQVKKYGYPVLLTSHLPLPAPVIELSDFYIYDKRDILSPESDMPTYWRQKPDGTTETVKSKVPYHAVATTHNLRNALDFCLGKFDWIYQMSSDTEIDLNEWFGKVYASNKPMVAVRWEDSSDTFGGQILASKTEYLDKIILRMDTWEEYAKEFGDDRFCGERHMLKLVKDRIGLENVEFIKMELGNRFDQVDREAWPDDMMSFHFVNGPYLHISGISNREYDVTYGNPVDGDNYYVLKQKVGMWSQPKNKFYQDWTIRAFLDGELKFQHKMNLANQRVMICMGSKALGDTLAWIPYIEEFRKKHNCHVTCSTWWNKILDYPEIEFIEPGSKVDNIYASYEVGCFDDQLDKNPLNWRTVPLQKVASDILGIEFVPIKAKIKTDARSDYNVPKHVCFSEFSTMQNKMWNFSGGWQKVIDYLNGLGYQCWSISSEKSNLTGIVSHNSQSIESTIADIASADFYIGLNHGPSWIAYSLGTPYIMIDGIAEEFNNPPNPYRIKVDVGCKPCFNATEIPIDRSWNWCINKDKYACTKAITPEMVFAKIDEIRSKEF